MVQRIPILNVVVKYFRVLYPYVGARFYLLMLLILLGGLLESFGLSMAIPILDVQQGNETQSDFTRHVSTFLDYLGLDPSLLPMICLLAATFTFKGLVVFSQQAYMERIINRLLKDAREDFSKLYAGLRYEAFSKFNVGFLNNLVNSEIDRFIGAVTVYVRVLVDLIFILVYLASVIYIEWKLALSVLAVSALAYGVLRKLHTVTRKLSIRISNSNADIQSMTIQGLQHFKYLKATNSFPYLFSKLFPSIRTNADARFKLGLVTAAPSSGMEAAAVWFLAGVAALALYVFNQSFDSVIVLILFFYRMFMRIFGFQVNWQKFHGGMGPIDIVTAAGKDLVDNQENHAGKQQAKFYDSIKLEKVCVDYDGVNVIENVDLEIKKNQLVGLVGESGAGKTTIFNLLAGLVSPSSGKIFIDQQEYKTVATDSIRDIIGYVTQEPAIFYDTVKGNILLRHGLTGSKTGAFRKAGPDSDALTRAVRLAHIESLIEQMPKGIDTLLKEGGSNLSGGQRQRIAIARELYKDPPIMIFDEATSALDSSSEAQIQRSIEEIKGEKTLILIAHRLSTILHCDLVYVLDQGRIVEQGAPKDLYAAGGRFHEMCRVQGIDLEARN